MAPLDPLIYRPLLERALAEDLGQAGDVTSAATVPQGTQVEARFVARGAGVLAGLDAALEVFRLLDFTLAVERACADGDALQPGTLIATIRGAAHPVLAGERVALNLLSRLSGIATTTRSVCDAVAPHPTKIASTRKTTPGLGALEKFAVRAGGGINHRFGLYDAVLIKDNHIVAAGGVSVAIARARAAIGHMMKIEVEVDNVAQLDEAMAAGVDAVLLDNMLPVEVARAVEIVAGRATTEASGGIRPDTVADYAATGVDVISLGWLTQNVTSLDIGLDFTT